MALASYTDLLASVASWMNRTDLGSVIPDFVTIAESRIARDLRARKQLTSATLATVGGTRNVALPTDWLQFDSVVVGTNPAVSAQFAPIEHLNIRYPDSVWSGIPVVYSIDGDNMVFGPTPDDVYTITASYFARFPDLATNSTNWLLTNFPNVYLYACLREGALYTMNKDAAAAWHELYKAAVQEVQASDDAATHSGSALRVRHE